MTLAVQRLTLEEFLALPNIEESPAWELLDGIASQKPMPTLYHSRLQKRLVSAIDGLNSPYEAFPELRCVLSQNSVVPDVAIVKGDRLPTGNEPLQGAPDWMIEILSPDQSTTKVIAKIQSCLNEGTQLGWLIDVEEQTIMVFWADVASSQATPLSLLTGPSPLPVLPDIEWETTVETVLSWC
ncbi:MAG: Uma2 family endonuclease [Leptolyngbyaceae bacterium]|nr:Uma2 family endonuclease [Leptolyngbyaceae bacterium]